MSRCADGIKNTSISSWMSCRTDRRIFSPLCRAWQPKLLDRLRASMIFMQASASASMRLLKLTIFSSRAIGTAQTFETLSEAAPFHNLADNSVLIEGPELKLNPKAAEQIGLAVHELGRNAVKHGALSKPTGVVNIRWEQETGGGPKPLLRFVWKEIGGPRVEQPERQGFGDVYSPNWFLRHCRAQHPLSSSLKE